MLHWPFLALVLLAGAGPFGSIAVVGTAAGILKIVAVLLLIAGIAGLFARRSPNGV